MKDKLKDVALRALKTFWQTALASIMVSAPEIVELIPSGWAALKPVLVSAGVAAIAAGLSAVWNGVIAPFIEKLKSSNVTEEEITEDVITDGGDESVDEGQ